MTTPQKTLRDTIHEIVAHNEEEPFNIAEAVIAYVEPLILQAQTETKAKCLEALPKEKFLEAPYSTERTPSRNYGECIGYGDAIKEAREAIKNLSV